jgi:pyridoxal phosphate enzyme (YggS family)
MTIASRLAELEERITAACRRAGRPREEVTLVAVTKTFPASTVAEGIAAGLRTLGENRVQEAAEKRAALDELGRREGVSWHLIGHLQSNKVRRAVEVFDAIHSIDSLRLAERVDAICAEKGGKMPVFLEVNLGEEASKAGTSAQEVLALSEAVAQLPHLELQGLMTVPPFLDDPEAVRPYFRQLRHLLTEIRLRGQVGEACRHLSMGMSHDFEIAIEEGSTFVRVGTALFGSRGSRSEEQEQ